MNTTTAAAQAEGKVTIETDIPESFKPSLTKLQERAENLRRSSERGIINEVSGSSIVARDNGQVNLASNEYSQYKLNPDGKAIEQSLESVTITNRKRLQTDEVIINEHKLNPHLYELTNFKQVIDNHQSVVGNFCVSGTVLVKCWEPNLKRYVMIRRPARMPMFSPTLNVPEIPTSLGIGDPLKETQDLQVVMAGGYQVNGAITDAKASTSTAPASSNAKKVDEVKDKAKAANDDKTAKDDKAIKDAKDTADKAKNAGEGGSDDKAGEALKEEIRQAQLAVQTAEAAYNASIGKASAAAKALEEAQRSLANAILEADKIEWAKTVETCTKAKEAAEKEKQDAYATNIRAGVHAKELFDKITYRK